MSKLIDYLELNPFLLAPMAGITDCALRTFMRRMGCGVVVSELVSATGLRFKSERTWRLMKFTEEQRPFGVQLFGDSLEDFDYAAKVVEDYGADFVDLNFGCPVPKVVKKGAGSAVLKDLAQFRHILAVTKKAVKIPVTIKIRTGWDADTRNSDEAIHIAAEEGITWVAIHGRTRAQGYSGFADWDYIREVTQKARIPIIGNGDIITASQAIERLQTTGCKAVMIGRGCLKNPFIFMESSQLLQKSKESARPKHADFSYPQLFQLLRQDLSEIYDDRIVLIQLKKFAGWYSSGFSDSSRFRKEIFQKHDIQEVSDLINEYFTNTVSSSRTDTLEGFLLGGHG